MSFVINTNTLSLVAQQNLNESQQALNQAIERLSSGKKINSAKDDAAGQAIANRLTAQINGLNQASANANDGISLAQTTEGALNQVNTNLQRIRELSVQAANGTNSYSDLESIQNEIDQRLSEIDRISEQTAFNGIKVLDGSDTSIEIQVGANDDQTITINLAKVDSASLGLDQLNVVGTRTFNANFSTDLAAAVTGGASVVQYTDADGANRLAIDDGTGSYTAVDIAADGTISDSGNALTGVTSTGAVTDGASVTIGETKTTDPLAALDSALKEIDALRSDLGAVQNRFDSAISNISTTVINLSSARSRIVDADYAVEVSNLSKAQILQQAGTSVLAQANQTNQGVLALLR